MAFGLRHSGRDLDVDGSQNVLSVDALERVAPAVDELRSASCDTSPPNSDV
jgi:hypothetical protein